MENDWLKLWHDLASTFHKGGTAGEDQRPDAWAGRAKRFDAAVRRKLGQPDSLREYVLSQVTSESTVVDIGAGTGSWTIPLARAARRITAVEPSPAMSSILQSNLAAENLNNVQVVRGRWEEVEVEPHDVAICSHAMYASPDLLGFVRKMEQAARYRCFLLMRVPSHDGVLGELSRLIRGQFHDSPNFIVAYNALLGAGIYANVMIEPSLRPWTNVDLEAAFQRARDHLRLGDEHSFDDMIRSSLAKKLVFRDGLYHWPDGARPALIWWGPTP